MVLKDGKVLIGKRKGSHGAGLYGLAGGHLEYMESIEECARREVKEETGIEIKNVRFLCVANVKTHTPKHYLDIGVVADWESGEPEVLEPHKCEGWEWYGLDAIPQPLFDPTPRYIEAYKAGKNFFDE